jgi:trigger factor
MATTTQSELGNHHIKVSVNVQKEDYISSFESSIKQYAKTAQIPGFRKGMVPPGMVKKMYGKSLLADEVLKVATTSLDSYLKEQNIEHLGQPMGMENGTKYDFDFNELQDYSFDFEVGVKPKFSIPLIDNKTTFQAYKVAVNDEMIAEEIEKISYNKGAVNEVEEISDENDILDMNVIPCNADGEVLDQASPKKNAYLLKYFSPEAQNQLKGKKKGDHVTMKLTDAFIEKMQSAVAQDFGISDIDSAYFTLTIENLRHVTPATLDTALFDQVYPGADLKDETEFKNKISQEIELYWEGQGRNKLHNDIFERLVHETPLTLPESFLKRWLAEGGDEKKPIEEIEKTWGNFHHSLMWQLISDKIIRENDLLPKRSEVEELIKYDVKNYLVSMGLPADEEESEIVKSIVDKQMADEKYSTEAFDKVATNKLFMWLEQHIDINMNVLPLKEFLELKSEHHHHH